MVPRASPRLQTTSCPCGQYFPCEAVLRATDAAHGGHSDEKSVSDHFRRRGRDPALSLNKAARQTGVPRGKYRLIDIPISNCINSEIQRIYVFDANSASLNRHIARTYALAGVGFSQGFVEVLAAQQTPDSPSWFEGTADAVRKYLRLFAEWNVDQYLILSGDHLYRMNYADFIHRHRDTKADITISVVPVDEVEHPTSA